MALNMQDFSLLGELHGSRQTIVVAPQECHQHITAPLPNGARWTGAASRTDQSPARAH